MIRNRLLLLLFALLAVPGTAAAQVRIDLSGGASLPVGDYSHDPETDGDYAEIGFTGIAGLALSVGRNFEWTLNGGIASHGLDRSASVSEGFESDVDVGRYRIHPFLTGPRLRIPVGTSAAVYFEGQGGIALINGPTISSPDFEIQYGSTNAFAWAIGGGAFLNRRLGVGARYIPIGDVTTEVRLPEIFGIPEALEVEQNISWVDVFLTLRLN